MGWGTAAGLVIGAAIVVLLLVLVARGWSRVLPLLPLGGVAALVIIVGSDAARVVDVIGQFGTAREFAGRRETLLTEATLGVVGLLLGSVLVVALTAPSWFRSLRTRPAGAGSAGDDGLAAGAEPTEDDYDLPESEDTVLTGDDREVDAEPAGWLVPAHVLGLVGLVLVTAAIAPTDFSTEGLDWSAYLTQWSQLGFGVGLAALALAHRDEDLDAIWTVGYVGAGAAIASLVVTAISSIRFELCLMAFAVPLLLYGAIVVLGGLVGTALRRHPPQRVVASIAAGLLVLSAVAVVAELIGTRTPFAPFEIGFHSPVPLSPQGEIHIGPRDGPIPGLPDVREFFCEDPNVGNPAFESELCIDFDDLPTP